MINICHSERCEESELSDYSNFQILRYAQDDIKRKLLQVLLLFFIIVFFSGISSAQFRDSTKQEKKTSDTSGFHMKKNPWLALGLSGVLPGAGQIYTGGWYKAPFIIGGIVGCFIGAFVQNGRYHVYIDSVNNQNARGDTYDAQRYGQAREFYRDDRDKFYIYAALVYIANLIDAYISAHLYDFDVSEPTGAYLQMPSARNDNWRLAYRMHF